MPEHKFERKSISTGLPTASIFRLKAALTLTIVCAAVKFQGNDYEKDAFTAFMLMAVNCAVASPWSLDSCISYAVEHSLQVRQRIVDVRQGDVELSSAKSGYLPTLGASGIARMEYRTRTYIRQYLCRPQYLQHTVGCESLALSSMALALRVRWHMPGFACSGAATA